MRDKAVSGTLLLLLLIGMLASAFNIQLGRAEPRIWTVDDDGPADFSSIQEAIVSPLVAGGDTIYVYNGTYYENVVVNKTLTLLGENREAIIDGGLTGTVVLVEANNVTLTRFNVRNSGQGSSDAGVRLSDVKNCSISGNNLTANQYGLILDHSSNNTISENNMVNRHYGILLARSSSNNITRNAITSNMMLGMWGIDLDGSSSNNSISANSITNGWQGLSLSGSGNNVSGNNVAYNQNGFYISGSDNNIFGNNITYNQYGFYLAGSDNTLRNNDVSNNLHNFGVHGYELADFMNDVDTSNIVDGKPVYYWVNKHSLNVPSDAGYVALVNCTHITAENLNLLRNSEGALLAFTGNSTITQNTIDGNVDGIYIWRSSDNNITGNTITNNKDGVSLHASVNNSITKNSMANNNWHDVLVADSSNNTITENDVTNSGGIGLDSSSDNSITGNNITNGGAGIFLEDSSSNNSIFGNNLTNNVAGIWLYHSSGNILRGNSMVGNRYNFGAVTYAFFLEDPDDFVNDVDVSNAVDGKPVYYWVNRHNETMPSDAGYVALINCTNIAVKNLDLKNNWEGILLAYTANTTIAQNNMTANRNGIYLAHSSGNTFSGNKIANEPTGIHVCASSDNKFYHNFIANPVQVWLFDDSTNVWDDGYPSGGNYWSDYIGNDWKRGPGQNVIGSDDIGDTPYFIDGNNKDNYPLMNPWIGRYVYITQFNLHEANSSNSTLLETILVSSGTMQNATISGDFSGFMNFTSLHGFKIETGPFINQGFISSNWTATAEGFAFEGTWKTFQYFDASKGAFMLKGAFSGDLEGIAEGSIVESVPGSGVYDQIHAVWRRNRVGSDLISAIIELNGTITYQDSSAFHSTELYVYQATMNGSADGYYSGPLSAVVTHVRIEDENSPCYGEGFSTISYDSKMGSGEGWTADKSVSPGTIKSTGMFLNPLSGVVSATLNESETLITLNGTIGRLAIDIGLSLQPELRVKVWGPQRVSPGETIEYVIEYGNYGLKAVEKAIIFATLSPLVKYRAASSRANYDDFFHIIDWNLGRLPAKTRGYLSFEVEINWGLPQGTPLGNAAYIIDAETSDTQTQQLKTLLSSTETQRQNLAVNGVFCIPGEAGAESQWNKFNKFAEETNSLWPPVYYGYTEWVELSKRLGIDQLKEVKRLLDVIHVELATPGGLDYAINLLAALVSSYPVTSGLAAVLMGMIDQALDIGQSFVATDYNGLANPLIGKGDYSTITAYSGGTRTTVTALEYDEVSCETLILISPQSGFQEPGAYKLELEKILQSGKAREIVIYQSDSDSILGKLGEPFSSLIGQVNFDLNDDWFDKEIDTPSGRRKIGDLVKINPEISKIDGKEIRIDKNDINKKDHWELFLYINSLVVGKEGMSDDAPSNVTVAIDPNIKYGPECYVLPGQRLSYRVEYENEGEGIAFGVYITDTLNENLNASTLTIGGNGAYDSSTRTITWFIGEVGSHENGSAMFAVNVNDSVSIGTEIMNFATVHFPSVPETTRTNGVVNVVAYAHDVAALFVTPSEYQVERGSSVLINVTVENQGVNTETFSVTAYANTTIIQTETVTLTSGNHTTVTFTWDTTGFGEGNYIITAVASVVPGETDEEDNERVNGFVTVYEPLIPPVEDTDAYIDYVNETIQDLADEIFSVPDEDVPDVKYDFSDLFNDTRENINEGNYEGAIEKLNHIKDKIYETMVESADREELIGRIDDLIAYLETLL